MFQLHIEHGYSYCYPDEGSKESNCFTLKFETMEEVSEYVNKIYSETREYCDEPPSLELDKSNIMGFVMKTYAFIPEDKRAKKEDIIKLLVDENDYDLVPKRDIEMYSIVMFLTRPR